MPRLYRADQKPIIENQKGIFLLPDSWSQVLVKNDLITYLEEFESEEKVSLDDFKLMAPISDQEVWASGVTYYRSREARMEESKDAGGGDFYDKVYEAPRPELFFKSTAHRVVGPGDKVRIRRDSHWNVPEPELTLYISPDKKIVGYTIGNDMSSRDIEGENPLYLPQAKSYDGSAALGPCILISEQEPDPSTSISMSIERAGKVVFSEDTQLGQMKRKLKELVDYLFLEMSFPYGAFLMTGTGIVPPDNFTLQSDDVIKIAIGGIGVLENVVD